MTIGGRTLLQGHVEGPALLDAKEHARSHWARGQDLLGGLADAIIVVQLATALGHHRHAVSEGQRATGADYGIKIN